MSPFGFLQRGSLAEHARCLQLAKYKPSVCFDGLLPGVDNLRHDVFLSPKFTQLARQHIARLVMQYGDVQALLSEDRNGYRPAWSTRPAQKSPATEPADFKRALTEIYTAALSRAKREDNLTVDLLARVAVLKFLKSELLAQFNQVLERGQSRLRSYEDLKRTPGGRAHEFRERLVGFQVAKKTVLRKIGEDLFRTQRDVEKETLMRMRRSLFGDTDNGAYELFLNRLLFTEDGRDDYLNAEHYVMLGNYERDPDRLPAIREIARAFLRSLALPDVREWEDVRAVLSEPDNAQELVAAGTPDGFDPKARAQKALLAGWLDALEQDGMMQHVLAAYEVVPILPEYSPPINAQQLKNALISRTERMRVEELIAEQGKLSVDSLHDAIKRVIACRGSERAKMAGRFLLDFMRYHREVVKLEVLNAAMERVNVISSDKIRQLSAINNTLYEFLLPDEQKPAEEKVLHHVILKADLRDSSGLTRTLYERGLNPASYFSLNFYEPVNRLLPLFGAEKVFIEGDAVILAIFEREGEAQLGVARCCALAKEMIGVVRAYNEKSNNAGLPTLELGIGISCQDSAPLYLMDGTSRVMISPALNQSDRLSSCSKAARRYLAKNSTLFNVFTFQSLGDAEAGGDPDEFLVRYNIGGVNLDESAFEKLRGEISLRTHELDVRMIWGPEPVRLFSGVVPLPSGGFQNIVVREGRVAHVNAGTFALKRWIDRRYYEVCTSAEIYDKLEKKLAVPAAAR